MSENQTAVGSAVFLSAVDQGLSIDAESFGLGEGCEDAFVHDQRDRHVGEQSVAMSLLATEVIEFLLCLIVIITLYQVYIWKYPFRRRG